MEQPIANIYRSLCRGRRYPFGHYIWITASAGRTDDISGMHECKPSSVFHAPTLVRDRVRRIARLSRMTGSMPAATMVSAAKEHSASNSSEAY